MLDKFLEIGSTFDWITPLWAFIQDARQGSPLQINVPDDAGFSGGQIQSLLKEKGIKSWGMMVVGSTITFTISESQALYTKYWLDRWNIPYDGKLHTFEKTTAKPRSRNPAHRTPATRPKRRNWIDRSLHEIQKVAAKLG